MSGDQCAPGLDAVIGQLRVLSDNGRQEVEEDKIAGAVSSTCIDWRADKTEARTYVHQYLLVFHW